MQNKSTTPNALEAKLREITSTQIPDLQASVPTTGHLINTYDSGVVGLNLGSGYLKPSGGCSASLGIDTEHPAMSNGSLVRACIRLAAGSKNVTLKLFVNGVEVASLTAFVSTAWTPYDFTGEAANYIMGDRLALHYSGLVALVDRIAVCTLWSDPLT